MLAKHMSHVGLLLIAHEVLAHKRRVAHHVAAPLGRHNIVPIYTQGIRLHNTPVVPQGEFVIHALDDLCRVGIRLLLGNPQGRPRHAARKVVNLDTVEVREAHPDGRLLDLLEGKVRILVLLLLLQNPVLKPPELEIRLCEEVARSTGRIKKRQRGELVVELVERLRPRASRFWLLQNSGELSLETVEKQRVDKPVNVLGTRVVHAT